MASNATKHNPLVSGIIKEHDPEMKIFSIKNLKDHHKAKIVHIDESLNHLCVSGITIKYEIKKKLLSIKNFKVHQKPKIDHLNESWCHLRNAVAAIQQSKPLQANLTWEDLYRFVDYLITQSCSPTQLYMDLRDLIDMHIKSCLSQFLMDATDQLTFLRQLNDYWTQHCHQMKLICNIFLALD